MKKILLVVCSFLILFSLSSFAMAETVHTDADSQKITYKNFLGENRYYYNGKAISRTQLNALLAEVPETQPEVKKARKYTPYMQIFAFAGGYAIGSSISEKNQDSKQNLATTGLITTIIAFRFQILMDNHYKKAIEIYNSKQNAPKENNENINTEDDVKI